MEKKGYLVNDSTSKTEFFVLRSGLLRVYFDSTSCKVKNSIHLAFCSEVNLLPGAVIEVRAHAPFVWEYVLVAPTEAEAESWYAALQKSISREQEKIHRNVETLKLGAPLFKYNYSNSKRTRRVFWISSEGDELCWARKRDDADFSKVDLKECIGLIYGPMTTTFVRCEKIDDPGWCCFSLLFMGRTLDLATPNGEAMITPWFLGLQFLVSSTTPMMGGSQFVVRKAMLKLTDAAHAKKLTLRTFLTQKLRATRPRKDAQDRMTRWPPFSPSSCSPSPSPSPSPPLKPESWPSPSAASNGRASLQEEKLKDRVLALEGELREAKLTVALATIHSCPNNDDWESAAVKFLREECAKRDETIQKQTEKANLYDALRAKNEKMEKALRKMAKALEKTEKNRGAENNDDVGSAKLGSPTEINHKLEKHLVKQGEPQLEELKRASAQQREQEREALQQVERQNEQRRDQNRLTQEETQAFQQKIEELEAKLRSTSSSSKETIEMMQNEAERRYHQVVREVDGLRNDIDRLQKAEVAAAERNRKVQNAKATILSGVKKMSASVRELKKAQRTLRAEAEERIRRELTGSNAGFAQVFDALSKLHAQKDAFAAKLKDVSEERRKLHNLVAELKGNIRVFCRVRPIIAREHSDEPAKSTTVSYPDDNKIVIYNDHDARKKAFEFDQIFHPSVTQTDVFAEAYPLATSVLDGYNICIFAYGQTGSGKTYEYIDAIMCAIYIDIRNLCALRIYKAFMIQGPGPSPLPLRGRGVEQGPESYLSIDLSICHAQSINQSVYYVYNIYASSPKGAIVFQ
eukprot:GEMP01016882.1.p1 GENE.GEMP01016882.1~~GEMP01016882.1.p1  ORF type:complete len:804 (+),score=171.46 GEMP01016882.1:16-2427(+)